MSPAPDKPKAPALSDLLDSDFMARLDRLDVLSRKILQSRLRGERRSKRRGQSSEFAEHRRYVVGDDIRFVDWNIYARLEKLFVKLFLEEQDLSVHLLLDVSDSTRFGEPPKVLFMKRLAAALAYVSLVNNNRLTLSTFADGLTAQLPNMRGRNYLSRMADFLLREQPGGPSYFEKACRQATANQQGKGVTIVISDCLFKEGYDGGLRRLISRQYDLYVMQVLCPEDREPDFRGDFKLLDIEDGDQAEITLSPALLDFYKRNLAAYCNELKQFCAARGAHYLLANSADPVEQLVLNYLRRIGLFR